MVTSALATHHTMIEAGVLHVLRDAILIFLLLVFLAGGFCGFMVARFVYRKQ